MKIADLNTSVLDEIAKFFRVMKKARADFTGPMQNIHKRRNLITYLNLGCPKVKDNGGVASNQLPEGNELCRLILGEDYITPEEMAVAYNFNYTDKQLEHFADTLPDIETTLWFRVNGFILIAGPPEDRNLLQVREFDNRLFYSKTEGWYAEDNQTFAKNDKVVAGEWLAIRKGAVPNSFNKMWQEQQNLITEVEHVPNAPEVSYAVTAYFKVRGIYLLRGKYVRTLSVSADGHHVDVGGFDGDGLSVYDGLDGGRCGRVGVASARK